MAHPWLLISGAVCLGWLFPEIGALFGKVVPATMNLMSAIGFGLIAAAFVCDCQNYETKTVIGGSVALPVVWTKH